MSNDNEPPSLPLPRINGLIKGKTGEKLGRSPRRSTSIWGRSGTNFYVSFQVVFWELFARLRLAGGVAEALFVVETPGEGVIWNTGVIFYLVRVCQTPPPNPGWQTPIQIFSGFSIQRKRKDWPVMIKRLECKWIIFISLYLCVGRMCQHNVDYFMNK